MPMQDFPPKIHAAFLVTFLLMFITTFVVAIGAILGHHPFELIKDKYTWQLFTLLIAEIAVLGVGVFKVILTPNSQTILRFRVQVTYRKYSVQLEKALNKEQREIWVRYKENRLGSKLTRREQALIAELKTANINAGQVATGQAYLNVDAGRRWLEGSFTYKFPSDQYYTHIPIIGQILENGNMRLELSQPERFFWDEDEPRVRRASNYSIELKRDQKDHHLLSCVLRYPGQELKPDVEMADVTFNQLQ